MIPSLKDKLSNQSSETDATAVITARPITVTAQTDPDFTFASQINALPTDR